VERELPAHQGRSPDQHPGHFAPIADESAESWRHSVDGGHERADRLQAELFEARKLESSVASPADSHDFNNILTAIIGFADLSLDEPPETDLTSSDGIRTPPSEPPG